jgi:hypothetical protein
MQQKAQQTMQQKARQTKKQKAAADRQQRIATYAAALQRQHGSYIADRLAVALADGSSCRAAIGTLPAAEKVAVLCRRARAAADNKARKAAARLSIHKKITRAQVATFAHKRIAAAAADRLQQQRYTMQRLQQQLADAVAAVNANHAAIEKWYTARDNARNGRQ